MKLGIIGAGPSGLGVLKEAIDEKFECTVFEQCDKIGGIWNYSDNVDISENGLPIVSAIYDGMVTNIPKETMAFDNFPHKQSDHSFINHEEVLKYIQEYATHFSLLQHIKFNTQVTLVKPLENDKWFVVATNTKTGQISKTVFNAIVICNGHLCEPYIPTIPGQDKFKGNIIHSHVYRKPDSYKNKNVLVVGAGPSGADISRILTPFAKKIVVCYKEKIECPLESTIVQKSTPIKSFTATTALFEDESEEFVDDVIFCTGYNTVFPFLSPSCGITVEDNWVKPLYKHLVNIENPTMAIINITDFSLTFPLSGIQARFFFSLLKKKVLITKEEMYIDFDKQIKEMRDKGITLRHTHRLGPVEMEKYCEDLANMAKIKNKQIVANKIFKHCFCEGFKMNNYAIVSDEDFELFTNEFNSK